MATLEDQIASYDPVAQLNTVEDTDWPSRRDVYLRAKAAWIADNIRLRDLKQHETPKPTVPVHIRWEKDSNNGVKYTVLDPEPGMEPPELPSLEELGRLPSSAVTSGPETNTDLLIEIGNNTREILRRLKSLEESHAELKANTAVWGTKERPDATKSHDPHKK